VSGDRCGPAGRFELVEDWFPRVEVGYAEPKEHAGHKFPPWITAGWSVVVGLEVCDSWDDVSADGFERRDVLNAADGADDGLNAGFAEGLDLRLG
jgi:hypothetical protein